MTPTTGTPRTSAPFSGLPFRTFTEKEVRYFLLDAEGKEWSAFKGGVDARRAAQWVRIQKKLAEQEGRKITAADVIEYEVIEREYASAVCIECGVRPVTWEWDCDGKFPRVVCDRCADRTEREERKGYHARRVFHAGGYHEEPWHVSRKYGQQN